jgi:molybdopterin synthase catalytic subunit
MNTQITVSNLPIGQAEFVNAEHSLAHGAQILFFGVVRKVNRGRQVVAVAYDAFPPLAEATLTEICEEARARWGKDLCFRLIHRTGTLQVGEISLAISVSSKHRDESYQASRYVIEELKNRAPVWKKEFYEDGESEWLKGHALCGHGHSGEDAHSSAEGHSATPPFSSTTSV